MAAMQKMHQMNGGADSTAPTKQIPLGATQKSTTSATSGKNMKVVSLHNQLHKKNAKSLNPSAQATQIVS